MEAKRGCVNFSILDQEISAGGVKGPSSVGKSGEDLLNGEQDSELEGHKKSAVEWPDVKLQMNESSKHDANSVSAAPEFKMKFPFAKGNEPLEIPRQENSVSTLPEIEKKFELPPPTQNIQVSVSQQQERSGEVQMPADLDTGERIVKSLCHVMNTSKIEYMRFDGNPINYVSFIRNFETCLEDDTNNSRKLQFLI